MRERAEPKNHNPTMCYLPLTIFHNCCLLAISWKGQKGCQGKDSAQ